MIKITQCEIINAISYSETCSYPSQLINKAKLINYSYITNLIYSELPAASNHYEIYVQQILNNIKNIIQHYNSDKCYHHDGRDDKTQHDLPQRAV